MTRTAKTLAAIRAAGPAGIAPRDLVPLVYDDPDGGPLTAAACVHVMAHILRKRKLITSTGESWTARYRARHHGKIHHK
jgi:hypothetical protein